MKKPEPSSTLIRGDIESDEEFALFQSLEADDWVSAENSEKRKLW